jgi:hypothetical protein
MSLKKFLIFAGLLIVGGAILAACGGTPAPTEAPVAAGPEVPYLADWQGSGHNDVAGEPFRHWDGDDPAEVPTSCAKCHTTAGYRDYLGADGSAAGKVDAAIAAADAQGVQCVACHNAVTIAKTSVMFPSGIEVTGLGDDSRCMECHQGRESKASVDKFLAQFGEDLDPDVTPAPVKNDQGNDVKLGFRNIHYFAAAATLYGSQVQGGYEYDGKMYDAKNDHVEGYRSCVGCHNQHTLEVRVEQCANCHEGVAAVDDLKNVRVVQASFEDYDGDGDTAEGMFYELQGLQEILYAQIQAYAKDTAGTGIVYDAATYPYFMADADGDGTGDTGDNGLVAYPTWTPRLLKAAYNYQVSIKDPGAFAHGNKYIVQLLHDSIEDLGDDVSELARDDAAHFAGNTEPFRHWDGEEDGNGTVPFGCVKCHTDSGLPTFIKNNGSIVVTSTGSTVTTGLSAASASNGFQCATCHNEEAWPERYTVASVTFPSGKSVSFGGKDADGKFVADDSNLCILCHQGRESTTSVNNALRGKDVNTVDAKISFKNIHYFAAGATLFGGDVQGAYQYEGKEYVGQNTAHPLNKCKDCHDVHALEPKVEACAGCHPGVEPEAIRFNTDTTDWDGDGDVTEGVSAEIDTLAEALLAEIQTYAEANGGAISYDSAAYPYWFGADGKGYAAWTPKLLKAAFNYQYVQKDPGKYVHNPKYVMQFVIDSIADLGGSVSAYTRP